MIFQDSVGIDFQENHVAMVQLRTSFKGIKIMAHDHYPYEEKTSPAQRLDLASDFVMEFLNENGLLNADLFLSIPKKITLTQIIEFPIAVKENIASTLKYELEKYVPFQLKEIYYDFQIVEEDKKQNKFKLLLLVVKKKDLSPYITLANNLGDGASSIEILPSALSNLIINSQSQNQDQANKILWAYFENSSVVVGLVNPPALQMTKTIHLGESIHKEKSQADFIAELQEIKNQFYLTTDTKLFPCGPDCDPVLIESLQKNIVFQMYQLTEMVTELEVSKLPENLLPCYGLALKGLTKVPVQYNLLPEQFRKKPSRVAYYILYVLGIMLLFSAAGWIGSYYMQQNLILEGLNSDIKRLAKEAEYVYTQEDQLAELDKNLKFLNAYHQNRPIVIDFLKELTGRLSDNMWVQSFSFSKKEIIIEGTAPSAATVLSLLEDSPYFKNATFASTITKTANGKEKFKIKLETNL